MKAEELRKSILQQAIQGKLVAQDPTDEPASVLLERIREEKKQLVKDKKIKKDKNESIIFKSEDNSHYEKIGSEVRCIDDEIPFEIPASWAWCRLESVSQQIHYGFTASAATTGNALLLRITDIQNNIVNWNNVPFCTVTEKEFCNYGLNNRDIMIARTGGTIGKTYIVRNLTQKSVFASYLIRVIPSIYINEEYLKLFMESPFYWLQLTSASMGTGQPNVNGQSLSKLLIPLPPLMEQKQIVKRIEELEPLLAEYDRLEKESTSLDTSLPDALNKSILQYAIQGKLVAQDPTDEPASVLLERIREEKQRLIKEKKIKADKNESIIFKGDDNSYYEKIGSTVRCIDEELPFELPDSWSWCRLSSLCWLGDGVKIQNEDLPYLEARYLRGKDIAKIQNKGKVVDAGVKAILVDGENSGEVFDIRERGYLGSTFKLLNINTQTSVDYVLTILSFYRTLFKESKIGAAIPHLNKTLFRELLVGLPPINEQNRIIIKLNKTREGL